MKNFLFIHNPDAMNKPPKTSKLCGWTMDHNRDYKESSKSRKTNNLKVLLLYMCSGLLVIGFVNLYSLYRLAEAFFGRTIFLYAPLSLPPLIVAYLFIRFGRKINFQDIHLGYIGAGCSLLLLGLFIPDPGIAVKRIHVTEYLLLALVIRYTMSHHLQGLPLLLFSCLFTSILGVHDEFLQGIHPLRTYGLKDMSVNCVAGCGGSLLFHGLRFFDTGAPVQETAVEQGRVTIAIFLALLLLSLLAMALPLPMYLNSSLPLWPFLPLTCIPLYWCLLLYRNISHYSGVLACTGVVLPFFLYPVLVNVLAIPFY